MLLDVWSKDRGRDRIAAGPIDLSEQPEGRHAGEESTGKAMRSGSIRKEAIHTCGAF